ncbi:MAG: hypothetical protein HQL39_04095 [Alphaproteobacteria bacterium]|nr:hypothetical protein [Alphaproteobacteria bacterium]
MLTFDKLHFLDPVDDEAWREKLFNDMAPDHPGFANFQRFRKELPSLISEKVVARIDPEPLKSCIDTTEVVASIVSDLCDDGWVNLASRPETHGLPSRKSSDGKATWQIFKPKIPDSFLELLHNEPSLSPHLIELGDKYTSWSLSYAAGSALTLNGHLAVAEELGLAPITDSSLHQKLLQRKLRRCLAGTTKTQVQMHGAAAETGAALVGSLFPDPSVLEQIPFERIFRFREETHELRCEFLPEILAEINKMSNDRDVGSATITKEIKDNLRRFHGELSAARDKFLISIVPNGNELFVGGGAGVTAYSIGSPAYALLASIIPAATGFLRRTLDYVAIRNKIKGSTSPGIAYLSKISSLY